jgi:hypothetical protein
VWTISSTGATAVARAFAVGMLPVVEISFRIEAPFVTGCPSLAAARSSFGAPLTPRQQREQSAHGAPPIGAAIAIMIGRDAPQLAHAGSVC